MSAIYTGWPPKNVPKFAYLYFIYFICIYFMGRNFL